MTAVIAPCCGHALGDHRSTYGCDGRDVEDGTFVHCPCANTIDLAAQRAIDAAVAAEADIWRRALQTVIGKGGRDS